MSDYYLAWWILKIKSPQPLKCINFHCTVYENWTFMSEARFSRFSVSFACCFWWCVLVWAFTSGGPTTSLAWWLVLVSVPTPATQDRVSTYTEWAKEEWLRDVRLRPEHPVESVRSALTVHSKYLALIGCSGSAKHQKLYTGWYVWGSVHFLRRRSNFSFYSQREGCLRPLKGWASILGSTRG